MVKKKNFWLTLLTVLTAVVLAFCACGLVGCSSESDDDEDDKTEQGTGDQGGGTEGGTEGGGTEGGGTEGGGTEGGGTEGGGTEGGGTEGGGTEGGGTEGGGSGDGSFVLQGYYDAMGSPFWGEITFNADNTGYFATYQSDGSLYTFASGEITWEYGDEAETTIDVEMAIFSGIAEIPMTLAKVDGALVAGTGYIEELRTDFIFYEESVVAALESKSDVGDSHAQVVLYEDMTSVVVVGGSSTAGTWTWTDDKDNVTITAGSTYSSTSVVANDKGQITQAVFGTFGSASDVTFLQMLDENLLSTTLYSLVSVEGYTLVLDEGGTYVTTVGDATYTGTYNPRNYTLTDNDDDEITFTPTSPYADDDGNFQLTFETYYGSTTNVVFVLEGSIYNREDSATYQEYYNSSTNGTAVAVLIGHGVTLSDDEFVDDETDDTEYWMFLYPNGAVKAHVYDGVSQYIVGDATWTWSANDDGELVPTFNRSTTQTVDGERVSVIIPYQAEDNEDGTWTVHMQSSVKKDDSWYEYTFANDGYPAGAFAGEVTTIGQGYFGSAASGNTVYLVLYQDGTFKAHIGDTTSDGYWSKDENGTMKFAKLSSGQYVDCEQSPNTEDETLLDVEISNNAMYGDIYTYVVDPSVVPVGGHDFTT